MQTTHNIDPEEIAKFDDLAARWWDPQGDFKPLHDLNPLRLQFIEERAPLAGKRVLDAGCGGGILAESMAQRGAEVVGIDAAEATIGVAKLHRLESGIKVDYRHITPEELANQEPQHYDIITCMELLEHVPDPSSVVNACGTLVRPGGHVFFSTINRNPKAYLLAIIGAEYVLRLLPKGTHDYAKFIKPSELAKWSRAARLRLEAITGLSYNPLTKTYQLGADLQVNYIASMRAADDT
ncbi:MAG: bifunctional 2-polyprenyl-6-hydroxyphenol methylase/3-demethylubiquinol 3-O-methyltransferase UbiG [Gammaproteobacteria bacterium]